MKRLIASALALCMVPIVVIGSTATPVSAAPSLPPGFTRAPISTGFGEFELVNFKFLPSGEILAAGKCGSLRRVALTGSSVALPTLPVYCNGDRGLLGIDLAPDFETSRRVYTLYNYQRNDGRSWARLSYWTANSATAPTALANEVVVIDDLPSFSGTGATCDDSHTIGTVIAAPDGSLFVGNGDASSYCPVDPSALDSYDLASPRGKILRVKADGTGFTSNPFFEPANPSSWRSRIFASGARNPFRFDLRPGTETLYVGDVGWTQYEEISVVRSNGANLGWPCWEGPSGFRNTYSSRSECQTAYSTMTPVEPIHTWPHNGSEAAAVGGTFYTGDTYPADYRGAFFFADYAQNRIWTLRTDDNDNVVRPPEAGGFASDIGAPVAFESGPGGDIFYADLLTSTIYRIRYAPGNRAPVAQIAVDRTAGPTPLTVQFDGRGSYDLDGENLSYAWTFGNGATSNLANPAITYNTAGTFTATLTVTDLLGLTSSSSVVITPGNNPPVLTVQTPPLGSTFAVGQSLDLTATATDVEDGTLAPASITFSTVQRHCPYGGSCHAHPGPIVGEQQSPGRLVCVINDHGDDSYLEAIVTARDSRGATATQIVRVEPRYRNLAVASSSGNVPIDINSSTNLSHPTMKLVAGSQNSIIPPAVYQDRMFVGWADGGPRERVLTMPDANLTLTAIYTRIPIPKAAATPTAGNAPLTVAFSSAGSIDPDGGALTYSWNFGDGSAASSQANPSHVYTAKGTFTATLTITDTQGSSAQASVAVTVGERPAGLVAGYSFDEASGTTVNDVSGFNHTGTMNAGVSRNPAGRNGGALSFNGTNGWVTVADTNDLDLTTGFTLSAWILPVAVTGWRTILLKEEAAGLSYALYGGNSNGQAAGYASLAGGDRFAAATDALPTGTWSHVTTTYDGATIRTYVNGALAASLAYSGSVTSSSGALRIGGNSVWGEFYSGLIDDVRVYKRALSAADVATDMLVPVSPSTPPPVDTSPPSTPGGLGASVVGSSVNLTWQPSTDNVGVTGYDVHRSTTAVFTPSASNRIAQVTATSYSDASRPAGTYHYTVIARDAVGLTSPPAGVVSATVAGDVTPPTKPTGVVATGGIARVVLAWTASTDDVGVTGYDVHRSTSSTFTPTAANRVGTVTTTGLTDTPLAAGTYHYLVIARDGAGRSSVESNRVTATATLDAPPTVQITAPVSGATVLGAATVTANAADDVGVAGVQFRVDGVNVGTEDTTAPYSISWATTSVSNGSHVITAVARDANGSTTTASGVSVTVNNVASSVGLVAAYGFNESTGTSVTDSSGRGNAGTVNGATRTTAGRFGGALSFDGVNDFVAVADSASLDLTTSLTISAWVRPTSISGWRTVIMKEGSPTGLVYALYSSTSNNFPGGYLEIGSADRELKGTASVVTTGWRHLSLTYDGTTMRMYIDGVERGSRAQTGALTVSAGQFKIGGNAVWAEWFNGLIDEVRVYNRALTAGQITTAMNTPL
jgi:glucose/arabinose dehydrogenase